jgi:hypothetical protein
MFLNTLKPVILALLTSVTAGKSILFSSGPAADAGALGSVIFSAIEFYYGAATPAREPCDGAMNKADASGCAQAGESAKRALNGP